MKKDKEGSAGASRARDLGPTERRVFTLLLSSPHWRWGLLAGLVVLVGVLLAVPAIRHPLVGLIVAISHGNGYEIRRIIRGYGPMAPLASVGLILLHTIVPLPAELLTVANGLVFGFWEGLAVSWSGFMLSALLLYASGRLWGRPLLDRAISERHRRRLDVWLEREGAFPLLVVRLIPLVPFNAVGLAAGVVRTPFWTYVWTTGVGILPLGVTVTLLGSRLGERSPRLGLPFWVIVVILAVGVLAAWRVARRRQTRKWG
jgi:uncharacterized membrane protein YdjX (TVP38/TMEM64 family)